MHSALTARAFTTIQSAFTQLDLTMPRKLAREVAQLEETGKRINKHRHDTANLTDATYTALSEDRDPATDPEVIRQAILRVLDDARMGQQLDLRATDRRVQLLAEHAPALIKEMSRAVERMNAVFVEARRVLGPEHTLTDASRVQHLRPAQLAIWGQGRDATAHLTTVLAAWNALYAATRTSEGVHPDHRPLVLADVTFDQVRDMAGDIKGLYAAEVPLSLADHDEFAARVTRYRAGRQEAKESTLAPTVIAERRRRFHAPEVATK